MGRYRKGAAAPVVKAPDVAGAPDVKAPDVAAPVVEAPEPARYFVAPGKAITCKRGVLGPGAEVFPETDGIGRFFEFLENGYLVAK
jgi:hypothetical protein